MILPNARTKNEEESKGTTIYHQPRSNVPHSNLLTKHKVYCNSIYRSTLINLTDCEFMALFGK